MEKEPTSVTNTTRQATVRIAADWTTRSNYQSQYAANNREAINAKKREWRKRTGKH